VVRSLYNPANCPFDGRLRFSTSMYAAQYTNSTMPPLSRPTEKNMGMRHWRYVIALNATGKHSENATLC